MSHGRLGRPREMRIDASLSNAVRELLSEIGYSKTTVDMIAARAGVGKPAIYRRYRSKAELIFAVAIHKLPDATPPDTGSLRGDLAALLHRIHRELSSPMAETVVTGLMSDVLSEPELADRFRRAFVHAQRDSVGELLNRAVERGELDEAPEVSLVHSLLLGPLFVRLIMVSEPVSRPQIDAQLEFVLRALSSRLGASCRLWSVAGRRGGRLDRLGRCRGSPSSSSAAKLICWPARSEWIRRRLTAARAGG